MISNPKFGWCDFKLNEFSSVVSYLTNVPLDLLDGFIRYEENKKHNVLENIEIYFDEEGNDFTLVLKPNGNIFIYRNDELETKVKIKNSIEELEIQLINDLDKDLNDWVINFIIDENDFDSILKETQDKYNKLKNIVSIKAS